MADRGKVGFYIELLIALGPMLIIVLFAPFNFLRVRKESVKVIRNYKGIWKLVSHSLLLKMKHDPDAC